MLVTTATVGRNSRKDASLSSASAIRWPPLPCLALPPSAVSSPPITQVGSMPPATKMLAIRPAVVVLPWLPATAMPKRPRISAASSAPLGSTGTPSSRALASSTLSASMAVEATTSSASCTAAAWWPWRTTAPSVARRRTTALSATSEPLTA